MCIVPGCRRFCDTGHASPARSIQRRPETCNPPSPYYYTSARESSFRVRSRSILHEVSVGASKLLSIREKQKAYHKNLSLP